MRTESYDKITEYKLITKKITCDFCNKPLYELEAHERIMNHNEKQKPIKTTKYYRAVVFIPISSIDADEIYACEDHIEELFKQCSKEFKEYGINTSITIELHKGEICVENDTDF